jgi:hypothetical protein
MPLDASICEGQAAMAFPLTNRRAANKEDAHSPHARHAELESLRRLRLGHGGK